MSPSLAVKALLHSFHLPTVNHPISLQLPIVAEHQKKRRQAISVLKSLLANPDLAVKGDGSTGVDKKFVRDALILLTSAETVNLLDWDDIAENGSTIPW